VEKGFNEKYSCIRVEAKTYFMVVFPVDIKYIKVCIMDTYIC
jgi:hypothetical protein